MIGPYIVKHFAGLGEVMIDPRICDRCKEPEDLEVLAVGICAPGDEINGCRLLATKDKRADWWTIQPGPGAALLHYCPSCWTREAAKFSV